MHMGLSRAAAAQVETRRIRIDGSGRVWALNVLLVAAALALYLGLGRHINALPRAVHLPWPALAALFFMSEVWVVHVYFHRDAHSFSLSEIPLVLGLFFLSPGELVLAQVLGAGAALALYRRQSPQKLVFNLGNIALGVGLAAILFRWIVSLSTPFGLEGVAAALLATSITATLGVVMIALAVSLSEGRLQTSKLRQVFGLALIGSITNTSLALITVIILSREPAAAWLLLVPATTLFVAYRAYISERQKHESIEFLFESSRLLQRSTEVEPAMLALLAHARKMFRAGQAEITLFPALGEDMALRTTVGPDNLTEVMHPVEASPLRPIMDRLSSQKGGLRFPEDSDPALRAYGQARGIRDAMITSLQGEDRLIGLLVVANRLGDVSTFDAEDQRLFETLAGQASVSLENGRLEQSLSQLRLLEEELKHQAFHDSLTRLANRALFIDRVEHALQRWERTDQPVSVLFIDLDDFKSVNDSLGHAAGDQLLVLVADRIKAGLRPADTAARLGGDEFAVLLDEVSGLAEASAVADRVIASLQAPFDLRGHLVRVHASIGIALHRPDSARADELMRNADMAMYSAKSKGKGRTQSFEPAMQTTVLSRHELKADLQGAVQRDEFVLHYQPIVALETGVICWFEALVRWNHPQRGPIAPMNFISLAEETGVIVELGAMVLKRACRQAAQWKASEARNSNLRMSVNLSAKQLQEPNLVEVVADALRESGLDPKSLVLEITENAMIEDTQATQTQFRRLKDLGVLLAIDDFGTGYSSLSWLRQFPVDILKIAKPFVDGLGTNPEELAFLRAITDLGRSLDMEMVAEGIEKPGQVEQLRALQLGLGQGFFYAMPMGSAGAEQLLVAGPLGSEFAFA